MRPLAVPVLALVAGSALAHQPVMDMAPRWNGGYGVQTRLEHTDMANTTWIEGVYTFKPALRLTAKVPFIDGELGDAIVAMPLKKYTNHRAATSNWGVTPQLRIPTGGGSDYDVGLSVSYSAENKRVYQLYDLYSMGGNTGFDLNVGLVYADGNGSSWFTLWDISALDSDMGTRVLTGPVAVYFRRNLIARVEYKFVAYDNDRSWTGDFLSVGLGVVF